MDLPAYRVIRPVRYTGEMGLTGAYNMYGCIIRVYGCVHVDVCVYVCIHVCVYVYGCVHMYVYVRAYGDKTFAPRTFTPRAFAP